MTDNDKNCGYPGCDGNHAHTPEEVAALPEVQAACDDLAWEKAERPRFAKAYTVGMKKGVKIALQELEKRQPLIWHAWLVWLAAKREAVKDYDFAGQAVKDAALLERELHEARTKITVLRVAGNAGVDNEQELKKQLATANERCAKAEAVIRCSQFKHKDGCAFVLAAATPKAPFKSCDCGQFATYRAWQLTLPAEEKEPR